MQNYSLSGDHLFGSLKMDWMASYAAASEERLNERYIEYELGDAIGLNHNVSNPRYPFISPANASDASLDNFELKEITEENQFTEEKDFNAFLNFELPTDLFGQGDGTIKFGGRLRSKNKDRDNNFFEFSPTGDEFDTMSDQPLRNISDPDFLAGAQYQAGEFVDQNFLGGLNLNDGSRFEKEDVPDEYVRANYDVSEKVYGGYVMVDQPLSSRLNLLAGIRLEHTNLEATGNEIQDEEEVIGTITETNSYTNILPSIHLKYDLTDKTILRLAWTNTLARPNYADLVPSEDTLEEDEEIFRGNPDLDATTSMNFDLMAEHYFNNVGIISGGLFYKDINDFIYTYQSEDAATGYDVFQPQNGDKASVFGAEVSFQRQLDFLPGFAKNFSLMLNYTYLTSSADGIRNEDGEERTDLDLPGTSPNMFNGSLAYAGKKLNLRLSVNYSDAYLDEIGGSAFTDRYYDKQFLMDFNASYAVNKNLSVYMDLNNMTNQALRYYQGHVNRTMQMEYYGRRLTFGLKYNLFGKQ
jgi:TonB-dependent receptor